MRRKCGGAEEGGRKKGKSKGCTWAMGWATSISKLYVVSMQCTYKEEALLEALRGSVMPRQGVRPSATSEALEIWYVPFSVMEALKMRP